MIEFVAEIKYFINGETFKSLEEAKRYYIQKINYSQSTISITHFFLKRLNAEYEKLLKSSKEDFNGKNYVLHNGVFITKPAEVRYLMKLEKREDIKRHIKRLKSEKQTYYSFISSLKEIEERIEKEKAEKPAEE